MNIEEFRGTLESISVGELIRYIHKYICLSLAYASQPAVNYNEALDLLYAECTRRGMQHLYDMSHEHVCRQPKLCTELLAA